MLNGKKSFFNNIFCNFILLLCVPLVSILLIFNRADKIVKEQVMVSASKNLDLYYAQIEDVMEEMRTTCLTILSNSDCELYSLESMFNSGQSANKKLKIYEYLKNLINSQYHDVFIYYYRDNSCISGKYTSLTAERYYDAYYGEIGKADYKDEFLSILKSDTKRPTCHVIRDYTGKSYLCMTIGVRNNREPLSNYTICVVISPEYLNDALIMMDSEDDSVFLTFNENMQMVLSNTALFNELDVEQYLQSESVDYDTWIDRKNYMIQVRKSDLLGNNYVYIVFSEYFWEMLRQLRSYFWVGTVICIIISIYFAYQSARKTYNPIGDIMEYICKKENGAFGDIEKESEFSCIMSYIKNNEGKLKERENSGREWCLYNLLEGKISKTEVGILERNGITFQYEKFFVCVLQIEMAREEIDDLYYFIIRNVFEELGNRVGKAYLVELSKTRCALLINMETYSDIKSVLDEGQKFLKQFYDIVITMGCSDIHESESEISELYMEALDAIRYRFLMGLGRQIYYSEICKKGFCVQRDGESKLYMLLLDYVRGESDHCDASGFAESLAYIYEINENVSIDAAVFFKMEVIKELTRIMTLRGYDGDVIGDKIKLLKETDTLTGFQRCLSECVSELRKKNSDKKTKEDICVKTKNYIDQNYSDDQLSVAVLGREMGMQPAHLSKLFREAYNISLLDYIASVRIFQAKRLIREEHMSVQATAEKVGFMNINRFIRIFKKIENVTPGKYRELCEKEHFHNF